MSKFHDPLFNIDHGESRNVSTSSAAVSQNSRTLSATASTLGIAAKAGYVPVLVGPPGNRFQALVHMSDRICLPAKK